MDKIKIAVVVVTYNRKELLQECLNSLLKQTRIPDSILIIDNASTDGTREILEKYYLKNPIFDYLSLKNNTGASGGFYYGIKKAYEKGFDWIWVMDDDATPKKDCLEKLLSKKGANKNIDILAPLKIDIHGKIQTNHFGNFSDKSFSIRPLRKDDREISFSSFVGPLFNRNVIKKVGFPNENFFIWHTDYEYFLRIKTAGFKTYLVDSAVIVHNDDYGRQKKKKLSWKNYYGWRNKFYIKKKYCKPFWFYLYLVVFLLWQTSEIIFVYHQPKYIETLRKALFDGLNGKLGFRGFDI